jgi:hypothetical protein
MVPLATLQCITVQGGYFMPLLRVTMPVLINSALYLKGKQRQGQVTSATGLSIAAGTGLITGSIGLATNLATQGTISGSIAWAPTCIAFNSAGKLIAQQY